MELETRTAERTQRAAIVTTLRNVGPTLNSFITYHQSIGFAHIFLFFDDPEDPSIPLAESYADVTVIRHDARLRERWQQTRVYALFPHIRNFIETEVMARQTLNAEVAIQLALERGIDWLLHIDSDELFYTSGQSVGAHFQELTDRGLNYVTYANHEAVTETDEVEDPFREVTLFKRNPASINAGNLTEAQRALARELPQLPEKLFFYYRNGKSAARLSPSLIPDNVHGFTFLNESRARRLYREFLGGPLMRSLLKGRPRLAAWLRALVPSAHAEKRIIHSPCVLHYPCCGFAAFWRKYEMWGAFPDQWFGQLEIRERLGSFTLDARDLVLSGDRDAALRFYRRYVVMEDERDSARLIKSGLGCRIMGPSQLLAALGGEERRLAAQALGGASIFDTGADLGLQLPLTVESFDERTVAPQL